MRRDAGFKTAYAFYHRNGGKRTFPFTYAYYTKIERGLSLPRGEWLPLLLSMLRIRPTAESQREFVLAYLKDQFGDPAVFSSLVDPLLSPAPTTPPEKRVIKRLLSDQAYHVTPEQFKCIVASPAAYWTFNCLLNNTKALTPDELATATGFKVSEIKAAAAKLTAKKCLKKGRGGAFSCPFSGKYCLFPRDYKGYAKDLKSLEACIEGMYRTRGTEVLRSGALIRLRAAGAAATEKSLMDVLGAASADSIYEEEEGSGFFVIEARIRKVLPF